MTFPGADFLRATPESKGVDSRAIADALEAIAKSGLDVHSMLLLRDGEMVFEHYFAPYDEETAHSMYSVSKTFTSMLIGIARGKGLLSLEDKVLPFFPEVPIGNPSENLSKMTVRDLLIMGCGHGVDPFRQMYDSEDWARVFLNHPVPYQPGAHFLYNTGGSYMLSAILTKLTGKTALQLAEEWIFQKIGIKGAKWLTCPKGISQGGTGLKIRPRDMARFGLLLQNEGVWAGEQVIPRDYVLEAQKIKIDNSRCGNKDPNWISGYCYQMWRCAFDAFRCDGLGGQFIVMLGDRRTCIVFTSALGENIGFPLNIVRDYLLGAIGEYPLPENAEAQKVLLTLSKSLSHPAPQSAPEAVSGLPYGVEYALSENGYGFRAVTLTRDALIVRLTKNTITLPYFFGAPGVARGALPEELEDLPAETDAEIAVASVAEYRDGLCLRVNIVEEPFTVTVRFAFSGNDLTLDLKPTMGDPIVLKGVRA